jgi:hypothetical protein
MMKHAKTKKPFWEMTPQERAEDVKEFDKPLGSGSFKPLTPKGRARFERARRAGGLGIHKIHAFDLDSRLLSEAAVYAKQRKLTMSQLVERGLRRELAVRD